MTKIGVRITADGFQTETLGPFIKSTDHLVVRLRQAVLRKLQFLRPTANPPPEPKCGLRVISSIFEPKTVAFHPLILMLNKALNH